MGSVDKSIAITFDDGYKDNITEAAAALAARGMTATFFITTSNIDGKSDKRWVNGDCRKYMSWDDITQLGSMGFEVGSHMIDHVDMSRLADGELFRQLEGSRRRIIEKAGITPKTCSYPYGGLRDRVIIAAKNAGYIGGCSSLKGLNTSATVNYILKRTEIDGYDTINDFTNKLMGYYD